jgi:predicted N-acyltransferase
VAQLRLLDSLAQVPAAQWDALHGDDDPFVSHAFLHGLETTQCLRPRWGWTPRHAALYDGATLLAAAPAYRKDNSHGEFVFDFAWAAAYSRAGRAYYPKWLLGVPYSPVTGPRLLARDDAARRSLAALLPAAAHAEGCSSVHVNFLPEDELGAFDDQWLARQDVQFHWQDRGWADFDDFLAALTHRRRKAIRQERDKVRRAGYGFRVVHGDEADAADLDAMHGFYCSTFAEKGNSPALTREFFSHLARALPRRLVLVLAERTGRRGAVAGALFLRGRDTLYGRYWGSDEAAPGLHFEACYYQGIEYCLRERLARFEPGAQGEHKLARGFLPATTHSRHRVLDADFAHALAPWCAQERAAVARYRDLLLQHSPFRDDPPAPPGP